MSDPDKVPQQKNMIGYPADWDLEKLHQSWLQHMRSSIEESEAPIPLKRLQHQLEGSPVYYEIMQRWPKMDGGQRLQAWKILLEYSEQAVREVLPACVQCGECCRRSSPTLHVEDLELLSQGKLPWEQLFTLRQGEPVRSPKEQKVFFLLDERIKVREKPGTQECVFLSSATDQCSIYVDRPLQCRAQACWDPSESKQVAEQAYLTRRDIFGQVELLLDLIKQHHQRCSFAKLQAAAKAVEENNCGKTIDELVKLLAYEDHFRNFFSEKFNIPEDNLDLVFGRSFSHLISIFGLRVETEQDGTKCLVPDNAA
jgi:Fe-S-cluster containining protein